MSNARVRAITANVFLPAATRSEDPPLMTAVSWRLFPPAPPSPSLSSVPWARNFFTSDWSSASSVPSSSTALSNPFVGMIKPFGSLPYYVSQQELSHNFNLIQYVYHNGEKTHNNERHTAHHRSDFKKIEPGREFYFSVHGEANSRL